LIHAGEGLLGIECPGGLFAAARQGAFQLLLGDVAVAIGVGLSEALPSLAELVLADFAILVLVKLLEDLLWIETNTAAAGARSSLGLARLSFAWSGRSVSVAARALAGLALQRFAGRGAFFVAELSVAVLIESLKEALQPLAPRLFLVFLSQKGERRKAKEQADRAEFPTFHKAILHKSVREA
jgi:hypothetical protein